MGSAAATNAKKQ